MGWTESGRRGVESSLDGIALMDRAVATVNRLKPATAYEMTRLLAAHMRAERPELSEVDATTLVFRAVPELYDRYQRESADQRYVMAAETPTVYDTANPKAMTPTSQAVPNGVDVIARVQKLVADLRAANPLLTEDAAIAQVFRDPILYSEYVNATQVART